MKKPPRTGNTENTKEEYSENSKGKLKDISNTDKETKQTNVLGKKKPLKETRQKTLVTIPKKMKVRIPRRNLKVFQIQTKNLMEW